jgi:homogentisate 1,2-dioxygenase
MPRAYNLLEIAGAKDVWQPTFLLQNEDVKMGMMRPEAGKTQPYFYRTSDGDTAYFIHEGGGLLESDFGNLSYKRGDYVVVPKGTTIRFQTSGDTQKYLVFESRAEMNLPEKGLLGQHALFDPAMLESPTPLASEQIEAETRKAKEFELRIKRDGQWTRVTYSFYPLDAVGWKGTLTVVKINIKDFRPVVSPRYHLAPSVHSTFLGQGFVICSFVPRPFETDPEAVRVPFYHRNIDCDEVIFYHDGDFFSRKNMGAGMVTFHPAGIHHGPHPKAAENAAKKTETNEYAVMLDTFRPLHPTEEAKSCEWADYHMSWRS